MRGTVLQGDLDRQATQTAAGLAIAASTPYIVAATLSFSTFCFPYGFSFFDLDLTEPGCRKMWAAKH